MRIFTFLSLLLLSSCGFSPLYRTNNAKTTDLTATVQIQPIADYDGYLLENYLADGLNPNKMSVEKKYTLDVSLNAPQISEQNIQNDNFSSRERMSLTATYRLTDIKTGNVVVNTTTSATGAYNIATQPYATWMAQTKVRENLIKMLADRIVLHVVAFVKKNEVSK
jgi:LPS-assembly lipoprotein